MMSLQARITLLLAFALAVALVPAGLYFSTSHGPSVWLPLALCGVVALAAIWPLLGLVTKPARLLPDEAQLTTPAQATDPMNAARDLAELDLAQDRLVTERAECETALRQRTLELAHRTSELAAANEELGAFLHAVAHDVRAPLRSIEGFTEALIEDYGTRLDPEGVDYLQRVRTAAGRMEELISDLMNLAQLSRGKLVREEVDLGEIVNSVASALSAAEQHRVVELTVDPAMRVDGDRRLLRVVFEHLLGNAWKFTKGREIARVAVGMELREEGQVVFVRDNGVGFEQAYAERLFTPFKRLHTPKEFEGRGIGLAAVKRIVHRHGGRVWARGVADGGAEVYLSLNPSEGETET